MFTNMDINQIEAFTAKLKPVVNLSQDSDSSNDSEDDGDIDNKNTLNNMLMNFFIFSLILK